MCIRDRLLAQVFHILVVYGLEYFLGLIGQTFFQALKGLLPVPGLSLIHISSHRDVPLPPFCQNGPVEG